MANTAKQNERANQIYALLQNGVAMSVPEIEEKLGVYCDQTIRTMIQKDYLRAAGKKINPKGNRTVQSYTANGKAPPIGQTQKRLAVPVETIRSMFGLTSKAIQGELGIGLSVAAIIRDVASLLHNDGLSDIDKDRVNKAVESLAQGGTMHARQLVAGVVARAWGGSTSTKGRAHQDRKARESFDKTIDVLTVLADGLDTKEIPLMSEPERSGYNQRLSEATKHILAFRRKILKGG